MTLSFKEKVFNHYLQQVNELIAAYQRDLQALNDSAANETKSTAGDKHETALAMLQIEQKNARSRLEEVNKRKTVLTSISIQPQSDRIVNGSLVNTNRGYFFVAAALGKITVEDQSIIGVSPASPLGAKLMGLQADDSFQLQGITYIVTSVM